MTDLVGYIAAACTTCAFIPQVVRVWRTRSGDDISLVMYVIMIAGILLWIVYGVRTHSLPLIVGNLVTLALALLVVAGKRRARD